MIESLFWLRPLLWHVYIVVFIMFLFNKIACPSADSAGSISFLSLMGEVDEDETRTYIYRTFYNDSLCSSKEYDYGVGVLINSCIRGEDTENVFYYKHVIIMAASEEVHRVRVSGCSSTAQPIVNAKENIILLGDLNKTCSIYSRNAQQGYQMYYRDNRLNISIHSLSEAKSNSKDSDNQLEVPQYYIMNSLYPNGDEFSRDNACINQLPAIFEIINALKCVYSEGLGWSYHHNSIPPTSFSYFDCKDENKDIRKTKFETIALCLQGVASASTTNQQLYSKSHLQFDNTLISSQILNRMYSLFSGLNWWKGWDLLIQNRAKNHIDNTRTIESSFRRSDSSHFKYNDNTFAVTNVLENTHNTVCGLKSSENLMASDLFNVPNISKDYVSSTCKNLNNDGNEKEKNDKKWLDSKETLLIILGASVTAFLIGTLCIFSYRKWSYVYNKENFSVVPMPGEKVMQHRKNSFRNSPASTPRSSFTTPYPNDLREALGSHTSENIDVDPRPSELQMESDRSDDEEDEDRNEYSIVQMVYQTSVRVLTGSRQRANSWSSVVPNAAAAASRKAALSRNANASTAVDATAIENENKGGKEQRSSSIQFGIDDKTRDSIIHRASQINERRSFLAHQRLQAREEEFRKLHENAISIDSTDKDRTTHTSSIRRNSDTPIRKRFNSTESIDEKSDSDKEKD